MDTPSQLPRLDRPINTSSEDSLNRKAFAFLVSEALLQDNSEGATVVGVSGAWGTGKSSLAEMVLELIGARATVVRFDPWMVSAHNSLMAEFFVTLEKAIGTASKNGREADERARFFRYVSKSLGILSLASRASGALVPGADLAAGAAEKLGATFQTAAEGLEGSVDEPTLREARDQVSADLRKLTLPVVVVIDDLDRLDRDEVRVTLQLVKAIADFPNVRYLLLYDREQIVDALSASVHAPEAFLEKIVNQSFDLPEATTKQRTSILDAYLSELGLHEGVSEKVMERLSLLFDRVLLPGLPTLRHIKRYTGTVGSLLPGVIKDGHRNIDPADFLALEFIRQYAPGVYASLREWEAPKPGGRLTRRVDPKAWHESAREQVDEAVTSISDSSLQELVKIAVGELNVANQSASASTFSERRFSCDAWRPVYFGFDESRASVSQAKWEEFISQLQHPTGKQAWLEDWNDREKRDNWVFAITARAVEIPWQESLTLLSKVFTWGDQQRQEDSQFFHTHHSWEFCVRFCVDAVLSVTPDELNPVEEVVKAITSSGSVVAAGYAIGTEVARMKSNSHDRWAKDDDLEPASGPLGKKLGMMLEDESIWTCNDVSTAVKAAGYLVDKTLYKAWWESIPARRNRLISYVNRFLGEAESFNWGFEEGALVEAIRGMDPKELNEVGRKAQRHVVDSLVKKAQFSTSRRREILA